MFGCLRSAVHSARMQSAPSSVSGLLSGARDGKWVLGDIAGAAHGKCRLQVERFYIWVLCRKKGFSP